MKLVVGLGNIGKEYKSTRHNIGFMVIDSYLGKVKYNEKLEAYMYKDNDTIFIKPMTYMNNSGISVRKFVDYYHINLEDVLIIQDDLDIEFGKYKLKYNSSSGGHNGIKSIINQLGSQEFLRLKIGIGSSNDVIDYVLGKFKRCELEVIDKNMNIYKDIIDSFIEYGRDKTMNIYNTR